MPARILSVLIIILILFIGYEVVFMGKAPNIPVQPIPSPTVFSPFPYKVPQIPSKKAYLTYLVGDSIVESLGANADGLRQDLIKLYPGHEFVNYNYGFGSTNILTLEDRLTTETTYQGTKYPPILKQGFDLIIIESFGYNPLSEYPLNEGLIKYEEVLDTAVKQIIQEKPEAVIALLTPIAPNQENFAKYNYMLSPAVRVSWVQERRAYINKMIEYANKNKIPLINVYQESLLPNGDGNLKYINKTDYIHPSVDGKILIEQTIAKFIFDNKIFPE